MRKRMSLMIGRDARRASRLLAIWCSTFVLTSGSVALGQAGLRPSQDGQALNSLSRTLGRFGGGGGGSGYGANSSKSVIGAESSSTTSRMGGNRAQPSSSFNAPHAGWFGTEYNSPWTMRSDSFYNGSRYRGRGIPEYSPNNPGLLLRRPEKDEDLSSQVVLKLPTDDALINPSDTGSTAIQNQLPLDQLVKNYIGGHRESYLSQGWTSFKNGQYRQAADYFGMAEAVSLEDVRARTEVKVATLYANVATGQYAVAINNLKWLLSDDPHTGELRDAQFLNRIQNVEVRYGNKTDYVAHLRALEEVAIANASMNEFKALRAVVLWGKNDRAQAMFYAKSMTVAPTIPPWSKLYSIMEASQMEPVVMESNAPASKPAP